MKITKVFQCPQMASSFQDAETNELQEVYAFMKFAGNSGTYHGTVQFDVVLPDMRVTRNVVRVTPHDGVQIFDGRPPDGTVDVEVSLSLPVFLDIYFARMAPATAVLHGHMKVKHFKYAALRDFASCFDTSTEAWSRFYKFKETGVKCESSLAIQKIQQHPERPPLINPNRMRQIDVSDSESTHFFGGPLSLMCSAVDGIQRSADDTSSLQRHSFMGGATRLYPPFHSHVGSSMRRAGFRTGSLLDLITRARNVRQQSIAAFERTTALAHLARWKQTGMRSLLNETRSIQIQNSKSFITTVLASTPALWMTLE